MRSGVRFGSILLGATALLACGPVKPLPPGDLPPQNGIRGYVGLAKDTAVARASSAGETWRVVEEDGRQVPISKDLRRERLNFTIRQGVVVKVTRG